MGLVPFFAGPTSSAIRASHKLILIGLAVIFVIMFLFFGIGMLKSPLSGIFMLSGVGLIALIFLRFIPWTFKIWFMVFGVIFLMLGMMF